MPRLGYYKSRNGCLHCKQRRVKCDENRPCGACERHNIPCSLATGSQSELSQQPNNGHHMSQKSAVTRSQSSRHGRANKPAIPSPTIAWSGDDEVASLSSPSSDSFPYLATIFAPEPPLDCSASNADLELMHHFTAVTWQTLPKGFERQQVWQIEVPKLALRHDILLHQLLAISASHFAHLCPERRSSMLIQASQHQDLAILGLRQILPNIDDTNCHAIFVVTSLLSMNAFATHSEALEQSNGPTTSDLLEVFLLVRGMYHILKKWEETIAPGPIGKLLQLAAYESDQPWLDAIAAEIADDFNAIPATTNDQVESSCREALCCLGSWIQQARSSAHEPGLRVVMTWCVDLSDNYISLLRHKVPVAVRVLSLYARILQESGKDHWYLSGWGNAILADAVVGSGSRSYR